MAYSQVGSAPPKLSFAKIAAMPPPNIVPALPYISKDSNRKTVSAVQQSAPAKIKMARAQSPSLEQSQSPTALQSDVDRVGSSLQELGFIQKTADASASAASGESLGDDQSQLSSSSLKQQSFDTKSMTSVTTFAMDEKESIRPDDSASVRAVEDDDSQSVLSRHSSFQLDPEVSAGTHRSLFSSAPSVTMTARRFPGFTLANPPRFGEFPISPTAGTEDIQVVGIQSIQPEDEMSRNHLPAIIIHPDGKLLEALASLKDRLPLLQLEEKIVMFLSQSKSNVLELPPQNSFNRLLTHKLADYYNLAHQVTDDNSSVRIFRSNYTTLPTPLADIAKTVPIGPQQVSATAHMKIMRRAQLGGRPFSAGNSTAASSSAASKAVSENGADPVVDDGLQSPVDGTPNRDKSRLTREEREAQYKAVRDRIFSDFQESVTSESGSTGETSASLSRSSSSSGKRKSRKHKAPKDDSFDSRSAFIAYGPMQMQQSVVPSYNELPYGTSYHNTANFAPTMYGSNSLQPYASFDSTVSYGTNGTYMGNNTPSYITNNTWHSTQQSPASAMYNIPSMSGYQGQPQPMMQQMGSQYPQNIQSSQHATAWMPEQYQNAYITTSGSPANGQWQAFDSQIGPRTAYQYGQQHQQGYTTNTSYGSQNPGSSNHNHSRSLFNPQTRSFVPNYANRGGRNAHGKAISIARGSEASSNGSPVTAVRSNIDSHKPKEDSLQQKYGAPPTLPKKPPPSQVPPHFTGDPTAATGPNPNPSVNKGRSVSNSNAKVAS